MNAWVEYTEATEDLVHLTHEGFHHVTVRPKILEALGESEDAIKSDVWKAGRAQREIESGFPTLHAHALLGLWGAFERLIEDVFIAAVVDSSSLLEEGKFADLKLPLRIALSQGEERAQEILKEVTRATNSSQKAGINQFENVLAYVSLAGETPTNVKDSVFRAQQVRHVWAHRGGVADAKFVERCPDRANIGEKLLIQMDEFSNMLHGLHMYAWTILDRHLRNGGHQPAYLECAGFKGTWDGWRERDRPSAEEAPSSS